MSDKDKHELELAAKWLAREDADDPSAEPLTDEEPEPKALEKMRHVAARIDELALHAELQLEMSPNAFKTQLKKYGPIAACAGILLFITLLLFDHWEKYFQ